MQKYWAKAKFVDISSIVLVALAVGIPAVLAFS